MTVAFDTHKFVRRLKEAGMPEAQAEAMSEAFKEAQGEAELATKADVSLLGQELRQEMKTLEERLTAKLYQALLVQTVTLVAVFGALKLWG
jgi:hypothetical protein